MSIRTKIDFSGITSDNIVTSDNKKYIHEDDEIFNSLKDEIAACENAQVQTEIATLQILEIKEQTKVIANEAIDTATERAENAAQNAETAQALAETAAINALEAERNVTETAENIVDRINDIMSAEGEIRITAPHALGDFYFSITSHMPDGVLPLNGSEVSRVTYSDLYNYVLNIHNELVTSGKKFIVSEEEWQNISIENNGYVPYYSYGTIDGMFRLPRMSGYLKATGELDEAGNYIAEGLPTIEGDASFAVGQGTGTNDNPTRILTDGSSSISYKTLGTTFSISGGLYGNSEHVTPETNTLFVGVWALTTFTQVGTANLDEIKEILSQCETILGDSLPLLSSRYDNKGLETSAWKLSDGSWLDGRIYTEAYDKLIEKIAEGNSQYLEMKESELLSPIEFPESYLVDTENVKFRLPLMVVNERTIIKEWREETEWYRIWSDGYLEQGGEFYNPNNVENIVNYHIPFKDTNYYVDRIVGITGVYSAGLSAQYHVVYNLTPTSFSGWTHSVEGITTFRWQTFGYIDQSFMPSQDEWDIAYNFYFKVSHGVDGGRINIEEKLTEFEETAYTRLNEVVEEVSKDCVVHVDKQVGELYFSFDNYCPDGVIPLDGRLVSRATYADLWQWVQEKGLVKDDALITTNDENTVSIFNEDGTVRYCQWYGSGDGSLTFRMPKINGYLGATGDNSLAGQYIAEGLPNITGSFSNENITSTLDGAFYTDGTVKEAHWAASSIDNAIIKLDASRSSSIYGNSEHVTPETNTLFVGVWAITASKAAVFDFGETAELLKQSESYLMNNVPLMSSRWDRDGLGNLGWVKADGSWIDGRTYTGAYNYCIEKLVNGHADFVDGNLAIITQDNCSKFIVDRINKRFRLPITNSLRELVASYKEGTQWYNIYSDGWVEQGGEVYNNATAIITVDLLVPFRDTSYTVDKIIGVDGNYASSIGNEYSSTWNYTTSSFTAKTHGSAGMNRFRWFAAGYGEVLSVSSPLRTSHLYFKLAHEFYAPAEAELQEKLDLIDNLVVKTDINLPTLSSRWDSDFAENVGWVKSEGQWLNGNVYRDAYELMVSRIGINDKFVAATVGTELTDENADKFLIDTAAVKFRLPLVNSERILVASNKTDTEWFDYYSDGWVEQGGEVPAGTEEVTFPISFNNTNYYLNRNSFGLNGSASGSSAYSGTGKGKTDTRTVNSVTWESGANCVGHIWHAKGYARILNPIEYNRGLYLFFKLADEVPSTVVNTQQIVDDLHEEAINFKNECSQTLAQGDFVIETFKDVASWYRLYHSGWIEQGGEGGATLNTYAVTLLKEMADVNYHVTITAYNEDGACYQLICNNRTTTGFEIYGNSTGAKAASKGWEVKGFIKTN